MPKITIPSDIDELQAVAEISEPEDALTEVLWIHRPILLDRGGDSLYCGECAAIADEPDDRPYPCPTAKTVLSRLDDEIKNRLTWLKGEVPVIESQSPDEDDDDEPVKPRKTGRRRRASVEDEDEF